VSAKRRLVDTNIIVRYLVQDHEKHAKAAGKLFEACDRGDVEIVVLPAVLAECVFVLESFYEHARAGIAAALGTLISSPGVQITEAAMHLDALDRIERRRFISWIAYSPLRPEPKTLPSPRSTKISESFPTFGSKIHKESKETSRMFPGTELIGGVPNEFPVLSM